MCVVTSSALGNQGMKTFHTMRKVIGVRYLLVIVVGDDNDDDDKLLTGNEETFYFFLFCRQIGFTARVA